MNVAAIHCRLVLCCVTVHSRVQVSLCCICAGWTLSSSSLAPGSWAEQVGVSQLGLREPALLSTWLACSKIKQTSKDTQKKKPQQPLTQCSSAAKGANPNILAVKPHFFYETFSEPRAVKFLSFIVTHFLTRYSMLTVDKMHRTLQMLTPCFAFERMLFFCLQKR